MSYNPSRILRPSSVDDELNAFGKAVRAIFSAFDNVRLATVSKIITALTVLLLVVGVFAVGVTMSNVSTIAVVWRDFDTGLGRRIDLFASLRGYLGYGGLIQHWDAWQAGDDSMRAKVMEDVQHIKTLQPAWLSAHPQNDEKKSLLTIMDTVDAYQKAVTSSSKTAPTDDGNLQKSLTQISGSLMEERHVGAETIKEAVWKLGSTVGSVMGLSALFLVFLALFYLWFTRFRVVSPIRLFMGTMQRLAEGNKQIEVPFTGKRDEIGNMARTVETFRLSMIHADELEGEKRAADKTLIVQGEHRAELTNDFGSSSGNLLKIVGDAVANVRSAADDVHHLANRTGQETEAITQTAHKATLHVRDVAAATEQLNVSIQEISHRVAESTAITRSAVEGISTLDTTMNELSDAAQKIGEIVALIEQIAEQTNLLALNATIEAQRAGTAGKGFAVVANEVKVLAQQTATATKDIGGQVQHIQGRTNAAVSALKTVEQRVTKADSVVSSIASAIEEQNAVTKEIAHNVGEASKGNDAVTESMVRLSGQASEVGIKSAQMRDVIEDLGKEASHMQSVVRGFLRDVRQS